MPNRYWIDQPIKATPASDDYVNIADISDNNKTKKSILSSLWSSIWGTNSSDNINEWIVNLFYTTARNALKANDNEVVHLTWNETISWIKSGSFSLSTTWNITTTWDITWANISWDGANLTNVPVSITGQTEESAITDWDELPFYDSTAWANRKIDYTDLAIALRASDTTTFASATQDISSTTSLVIAHWLGRIPRVVEISWWYADKYVSEGSYDGTTNTSTAIWGSWFTLEHRTDLCIQFGTAAVTGLQWTMTFDITNVIIAWTKAWSPAGTWYIRIKSI